MILDGEIIVEKDGRPNFSELQADLAAGRHHRMVYYAFDILYLDGFDLRGAPLGAGHLVSPRHFAWKIGREGGSVSCARGR